MEENSVKAERVWLDSERSFDQVLSSLGQQISQPNASDVLRRAASAQTYAEAEQIVSKAVGPSGFMEFVRFPLGAFARLDPAIAVPGRMVRLLVGNPLIMQSMARHVPEVGSYAPLTILIFEREGRVRLRYDRLASLLAPYGSQAASEIARNLDGKILKILTEAAHHPTEQ